MEHEIDIVNTATTNFFQLKQCVNKKLILNLGTLVNCFLQLSMY